MRLFKFEIKQRHRQIWRLIIENRFRLYLAVLCSIAIAVSMAAMGYFIEPVIDRIFVDKDVSKLMFLPIMVMAIFFLKGIGMYGYEYFMNFVGENIIRQLRTDLFNHIIDLPMAFFQKERTGRLMSRITNDVGIVKSMVSTAVAGAFRDFFTIVGLTGVIFYRDWKMAIVALVILPAAFYPVIELGRRVRRVSTGCQEAMAELASFLHEAFAGSKIVKAFGMEPHEKKRFDAKIGKLFKLEIKGVIVRSLSSPIMEFLGGIGIAFIIWYGGSQVISGESTPGRFMSFLACVMLLYDPVKKLSNLNVAVQQGMAAVDRIFEVIESESDIQDPLQPKPVRRGSHTVRFDQVNFGYDRDMVLNDISLEVKNGEVLALVGMSGGGKSSLVSLVPRFFDVKQGRVLIDGTDIRDFAVTDLRREIAIVTQEPILFNDTIRNNIAYGNQAASEEDILNAAKAAYAFNFIESFPKGFDTVIGELGGRLSGGEKQRLCIARALLKNAPILILDEATSSLDTESEALVQKALENLMKGRTTFVIAHRLSTIGYADRIIVVVGGRIVEEGTHAELMACSGEYCKLYQMQVGNNGGHLSET
ncbi:MAG: ABC transporter ATP-binding protein [Desulfobacterales bacterium]|nr:ABC transporter ATP-binding protein [Desulfobacterales bacterium]